MWWQVPRLQAHGETATAECSGWLILGVGFSSHRRNDLLVHARVHKLEPKYRESVNQLDTTRCGGQQSDCKCTEERRQHNVRFLVWSVLRPFPGVRCQAVPPARVHSIYAREHAQQTRVLYKEPAQQRIQPEVAETRTLQLHGEKATAMIPTLFLFCLKR